MMLRRDFLRVAGASLAALATNGLAAVANGKQRRNILLIVADQWRYDWLPAVGASFLQTPNIDKLCREGTVFTQAICNSPQCAPSRISLAAGQYGNKLGAYQNNLCYYPAKCIGFDENRSSLYSILRDHGYRVGNVGKLDLNKGNMVGTHNDASDRSGLPHAAEIGFTESWNMQAWEGAYLKEVLGRDDLLNAHKQVAETNKWYTGMGASPWPFGKQTDFDHCVAHRTQGIMADYQKHYPNSPWFLQLNFFSPHWPANALEEKLQLYEDVEFPDAIISDYDQKHPSVKHWVAKRQRYIESPEHVRRLKQHYAAKISLLDDCVGMVRQQLEHLGIADNTTIIMTADHGEMLNDHGLWSKEQMYEASIRVPLIVYDPDLKARGKSDALAELVDIYPTVLDFAGIDYDKKAIDGQSLVPCRTGGEATHKEYQFSEWGVSKKHPYGWKRTVRSRRYKLIEVAGFTELYDLENDPRERFNVAEQNKALVKQLRDVMGEFSDLAIVSQKLPST